MTTLKKSLKKNSSLKKNLKKNLSLKKSLKKNLKKVSGKENKSMRGGARRYRPSRYQRPPPPEVYKDPSMRTAQQQYLGNFKTAGMSILGAKPFNPAKQRLLPTPSPEAMKQYLERIEDPNRKNLRSHQSKEYQSTHAQIRDYLDQQQWLADHPNE